MNKIGRLIFSTLKTIFNDETRENLDEQYLLNSTLFYSLLVLGVDPVDPENLNSELAFLIKRWVQPIEGQTEQPCLELCQILVILSDTIKQIMGNHKESCAVDITKSVLFHGLSRVLKQIIDIVRSSEA